MKLRAPHRKVLRAFTLIELMVAMVILSMIITAIYACWTVIVRGAQAGRTATAQAQRERMSVRALQDAFGAVVMFGQNSTNYSFVADTSGNFASVSMVCHLSPTFPGSGFFWEQTTRRISFDVESGDGGNQLVMRQSSLVQTLNNPDDAYAIVLATNVSVFTLEFFDPNQNDWTFDWAATNQLPRAVRFALGMNGNAKFKSSDDAVSMVVALPAVAIALQDQAPVAQGAGGPGGRQRPVIPGQPPVKGAGPNGGVPPLPARPGFNFNKPLK